MDRETAALNDDWRLLNAWYRVHHPEGTFFGFSTGYGPNYFAWDDDTREGDALLRRALEAE